MNITRDSGIETAGYVTLAACLGIVLFTIFGANLIVVPGVLWLVIALRERRRPDVPSFFVPLLALAAWTLVSCAFSADPLESFTRSGDDGPQRDHRARRGRRARRYRRVRGAGVQRHQSQAARHARALHDVLGP